MKRAENNTGYLMLRAYTDSEWDDCDFVIVKTDANWIADIKSKLDALVKPIENNQFTGLMYWDAPENFYINSESLMATTEICIKPGEDWAFVETTPEEIAALNAPENRLDCFSLEISRYGCLIYRANGKHTGEEFYTAGLPFEKLMEVINN